MTGTPGKSKGRAAKQRAVSHTGKEETRRAIIAIAINLFNDKGYSRTSLSEIARQMNMDPSSLYYYFPSKSALVEDIFSPKDHVPSLEVLTRLSSSRTEQLYALIVRDTVHKCELPFDFIEMESIAHDEPQHFQTFFEHYRAFYQNLVRLIELGIEEGEFIPCEADERAVTILSVNEGLQHHYHAKLRDELLLEASGYTVRNYTPEDIGQMSARAVVPSIVTDKVDFENAAQRSIKLYYRWLGEHEGALAD